MSNKNREILLQRDVNSSWKLIYRHNNLSLNDFIKTEKGYYFSETVTNNTCENTIFSVLIKDICVFDSKSKFIVGEMESFKIEMKWTLSNLPANKTTVTDHYEDDKICINVKIIIPGKQNIHKKLDVHQNIIPKNKRKHGNNWGPKMAKSSGYSGGTYWGISHPYGGA